MQIRCDNHDLEIAAAFSAPHINMKPNILIPNLYVNCKIVDFLDFVYIQPQHDGVIQFGLAVTR